MTLRPSLSFTSSHSTNIWMTAILKHRARSTGKGIWAKQTEFRAHPPCMWTEIERGLWCMGPLLMGFSGRLWLFRRHWIATALEGLLVLFLRGYSWAGLG